MRNCFVISSIIIRVPGGSGNEAGLSQARYCANTKQAGKSQTLALESLLSFCLSYFGCRQMGEAEGDNKTVLVRTIGRSLGT